MTELVEEAPASGTDDDEDASESSATSRRSWWTRITVPQVLMAAVVVIYIAFYTRRSLDIHHALGTASYDSALYDQGVWLLSRFETPFVTLMGRNLFGDHASFILLLLVPLYWIWPAAGVLFFSQSAAIGAGAIPIFLYARKRLRSEWLALAMGAAYLLHPAVGWTNLENFHPDSYLGVFVGFAIWAALERRWKTYFVFVALALLVKEDASLVLVPLGVWVGVKRDWRIGVATVVGSLAFMAFAMFVVMRSLIGVPTRNTWRIPFGGPSGVIDTALTNPTDLVRHLRSDDRPWYLVQMTAPFAWLFVRLPSVALISGVVLFTNVLSTFWYQYQIEYHYSLIAVPALSLGTVYAIGAIRNAGPFAMPTRTIAVSLVAVAAVFTSYLWAPVPWGRTDQFYGNPNNEWANSAREIIDLVPEDAVVAAHYRATPHMAHRAEIYQFPVPFRSVLYGPEGLLDGPRIPDRAERVEYIVLPVPGAGPTSFPSEDWAVVKPAFDLVERNDFWALYERNPDVPIPPEDP
ncbi:DUF2079 domain-containing protein [Ilumatobacter nonamiensis]|uniref:DUF2079 domain-containing protein n=1 Tax=Ilumatobacter nonamiensis TaxID=467093 RepID=UPI0003450A42|nr:DUF2079 domain-containing protein [Ilumatobacter nonamiensis]